MRHGQTEGRADEVVEAVVGDLEADVAAVQRGRALHLGHLAEVAAYQRNHLSGGGERESAWTTPRAALRSSVANAPRW